MMAQPSTADAADSPTKSGPKSPAELLHIIQNLIPNDVANIQWRLQALKQTFYVLFVFGNLIVLIRVKLM